MIGIFNEMKYIFLNSSVYFWLQYGDHERKLKKSLRKYGSPDKNQFLWIPNHANY